MASQFTEEAIELREYAIRSCPALRNPHSFQQALFAAPLQGDWGPAAALLKKVPEADPSTVEHLAWAEEFAEACFTPLVRQQAGYDRAATAAGFAVSDSNAILDLLSHFHDEIHTIRAVYGSDWWQVDTSFKPPFSGAFAGVCLHAIVRAEHQYDEWFSHLNGKEQAAQLTLVSEDEVPDQEIVFLERIRHCCAANVAVRGDRADSDGALGFRLSRYLEPAQPLLQSSIDTTSHFSPRDFEPLRVRVHNGAHQFYQSAGFTPYTMHASRLLRVRGDDNPDKQTRWAYKYDDPPQAASDRLLHQQFAAAVTRANDRADGSEFLPTSLSPAQFTFPVQPSSLQASMPAAPSVFPNPAYAAGLLSQCMPTLPISYPAGLAGSLPFGLPSMQAANMFPTALPGAFPYAQQNMLTNTNPAAAALQNEVQTLRAQLAAVQARQSAPVFSAPQFGPSPPIPNPSQSYAMGGGSAGHSTGQFSFTSAAPLVSPVQASPHIKLPMFGEFDGTVGEAAISWLAEVRRYWQFSLTDHRGQEVMFTVSKLKKNAQTWFESDLAPIYGPDGLTCPAQVFIDAFTARFISPHLKLHAFEGVDNIKQGKLDVKTYTEQFNAALGKLVHIPGHPGISPRDQTDKYLLGLNGSIRAQVFKTLPGVEQQPLIYVQFYAIQADELNKSLAKYHKDSKPDTDSKSKPAGTSSAASKATKQPAKRKADIPSAADSQAKKPKTVITGTHSFSLENQTWQAPKTAVGNLRYPENVYPDLPRSVKVYMQTYNRENQKGNASGAAQAAAQAAAGVSASAAAAAAQSPPAGQTSAPAWDAPSAAQAPDLFPARGNRGVSDYVHHFSQLPVHSADHAAVHSSSSATAPIPNPAFAPAPCGLHHTQMESYVHDLNQCPFIPPATPADPVSPPVPLPPAVHISAAAQGLDYSQSLTMMLSVAVERAAASNRKKRRTQLTALADTGSTHTFISSRYANHVHFTGAEGRVKLADSVGYAVCKFGTVQLTIKDCTFKQSVGVMDLNPQFDMILGEDWMLQFKAVLSFDPGNEVSTDERCIRFTDPVSNVQHVSKLSQHFRASMLNSVIYNTIADVRHKVSTGENDRDPNPVTHMFMVQVSRTVEDILADDLGYTHVHANAVQHDMSMPHTYQQDYESYDQFDDPDAEVQVETESLKSEVEALVNEYRDRFPSDIPPGLPPDRGSMYHCIPLKPGEQPSWRKAYRLSPAEKLEVETKVRDLLEKGWIEPAHSPYGAPLLFVGKKDGGLRMCVDYRALNAKTVKNKYPIPRIDDLLDELHGAQYFTSLDLQQAYHQLRLKPEDIEKSAFTTHLGQFQYKVLSFGLTNAPATFQSVMNSLLRPHLGKYCLVYMDDVLIYSKTPQEHLQHLRAVLNTLREAQFYCKLSKCKFALQQVQFLGHLVTRGGVKPNPVKVSIIQDWPTPQTPSQLASFLGLAQYFSKFIPCYAIMTTCLRALLRKNAVWEWTEQCADAFLDVKRALSTDPVLAMPDPDLPFEVIVDACQTGVGAVLMQGGRPVAFAGRQLNSAETRYHTTDQELLAVMYALQQWRCYLQGAKHPFVLVTDHHPNTFLSTQPTLSRRQARWSERLQEYDFSWLHRPGKRNVADPVSRSPHLPSADHPSSTPLPSANLLVQLQGIAADMHFDWTVRTSEQVAGLAMAYSQQPECTDCVLSAALVRCNHSDAVCAVATRSQHQRGEQAVPAAPVHGNPFPGTHSHVTPQPTGGPETHTAPSQPQAAIPPSAVSPAVHGPPEAERLSWIPELQAAYKHDKSLGDPEAFNAVDSSLHSKNGLWYKDGAIVIPNCPEIKRQIITELHDSQYAGHGGEVRTVQLLKRYFWWPTLDRDARQFVKGCSLCQRNKAGNRRYAGKLEQHSMPAQKWEQVSLDFLSGLPKTRSGNSMIMVVVDTLTKMVHFVPCPAKCKAPDVARLYVQHIFRLHGWPKAIISDRDGRFIDQFWQSMCSQLGADMKMSTAHHHETAGQAERMNRVLEETLRHFVSDKMDNWDELLAAAEFAINNSFNRSIGTSPFHFMYGYHPAVPLDVGVSPNPDVSDFLTQHQQLMHAAGTYHAFAQQRLNADAIQELVTSTKLVLQESRNRQKQHADLHRSHLEFQPDDQVMLKTKNLNLAHLPSKKFFPLWLGPFTVVKQVSPVSYELSIPTHWKIHDVFHVNLLKPFKDNGQDHAPAPFTYLAGHDNEFEVESILDHSPKSIPVQPGLKPNVLDRLKLLVRWKHYSAEHDSWEPYDNLKHAPLALAEYGF